MKISKPVCGEYQDIDVKASKNLYIYGVDWLTKSGDGTGRIQACGECIDGKIVVTPV